MVAARRVAAWSSRRALVATGVAALAHADPKAEAHAELEHRLELAAAHTAAATILLANHRQRAAERLLEARQELALIRRAAAAAAAVA